MHNHTKTPDEFVNLVSVLKDEEKKAQHAIESAKQRAAQIEKEAREQAIEIASAEQEAAVKAKNEILAAGKKKMDDDTEKILTKARAEAKEVRSLKIKAEQAKKLASEIISKYNKGDG
jgi:vacuolar-type H+-ATPase subunit H